MARILILSLIFPPDGVSTALIMGELAVDLKAAGHDVTVVTTVPHYNRAIAAEAKQPLSSVFRPFLYSSDFGGVPVLHVAMPRKGPKVWSRLLAWVQFHFLTLVTALARIPETDVIVAPSPPLTIGLFAWLLGARYNAPFVYVVQEIYPDIAISLGAVKNPFLIGRLFALERFIYAKAAAITVIAERMRRRLLEKGVPAGKVRVVPNFVDVDDLRPMPQSNDFSRPLGLDKSFVVTYAGNIGPAQGLDVILEAAAVLRDEPGLVFLIIGEGGAREKLKAEMVERRLQNVVILPHQPYEIVPLIYAASDMCLVPLAPGAGADAIPSKVYRIMACERAIIACAEDETDLAAVVREAGSGVIVPPGSAAGLSSAVLDGMKNPGGLAAMGAAGRAHVVAHYSRRAVSARYDALIREVVSRAAMARR